MMTSKKAYLKRNSDYTVKAKASKPGNAATGKIIVNRKGFHQEIPALIFSPSAAERLLDIAEKVYSE